MPNDVSSAHHIRTRLAMLSVDTISCNAKPRLVSTFENVMFLLFLEKILLNDTLELHYFRSKM